MNLHFGTAFGCRKIFEIKLKGKSIFS